MSNKREPVIYVIHNDDEPIPQFINVFEIDLFEETRIPNEAKIFESEFEAEQFLKGMINIADGYSDFHVYEYTSEDAFLDQYSDFDNQ